MSDDFREEFRRGNPELPLVTRAADLLQKWINCVEGLIGFLQDWNEWRKNGTQRLIKRIMTAFEWKRVFVWRVACICVHVTQAQILPSSSKHVSVGMPFLGLSIGGLSHQSCMSLHIGTNNILGGSIKTHKGPLSSYDEWVKNLIH